MIKVSIVVPVYNARDVIKRCCDSILGQTMSDIELILVNDGSADNSLAICQGIKNNDTRVKLINIPNSGPANARNAGIKEASGEYIGFVDADDYININMYQTLYTAATKETCKSIDIAMCAFYEVSSTGTGLVNQTVQAGLPANMILNNKEVITHVISTYYNGGMDGIGSLCNKIYKRSFLTDNKLLIDVSFIRAEDHWFNFECFNVCNSFIYLDVPMYFYIKDSVGSVMKSYRKDQFDFFLSQRHKLKVSYDYNFEFDSKANDRKFVINTIEYMYLIEKNEQQSLKKIIGIVKNKDLIDCARNSSNMKTHQNILRLCIAHSSPVFCVFFIKLFACLQKLKSRK